MRSRPIDPNTNQPYYNDEIWSKLRLSSKNHVDVPVLVDRHMLHLLASHPTPPVFDGPEDRNGCRNHDEIRFWIDYLAGPESQYLIDDHQQRGGIAEQASVVILGDLNADPSASDGRQQAIRALIDHQRLQDPRPRHQAFPQDQGDAKGDPNLDTARFRHGNMRVDYVLPSRQLKITGSGVFWPTSDSPDSELISASDHRMVWIEVELP